MSLQGQISHRFFLLNIRHLSYFFCPAPTFSKTNYIKSLNFKCAIFMPYRSRVTVEKKGKKYTDWLIALYYMLTAYIIW